MFYCIYLFLINKKIGIFFEISNLTNHKKKNIPFIFRDKCVYIFFIATVVQVFFFCGLSNLKFQKISQLKLKINDILNISLYKCIIP